MCLCPSISVITTSPPTRTQARVTPNKKSTQTTQPTFPSNGKIQKEEIITTLKPGKRRPQVEQVREKKDDGDEKTEKYNTNERAKQKLTRPNK